MPFVNWDIDEYDIGFGGCANEKSRIAAGFNFFACWFFRIK
jgi:hypothetical protein